ncbi:MAG: hypothetical protein QM820_53735 [Minicystis sp.]
MLEKLDFMVRFWDLRARHEAMVPLTPLELGELLSLLSLMATDDPMPEPGQARGDGMPAQITARGGFLAAELRHVCAAGLVVVAATPLPLGQSTVVRIAIPASGVEYTLPCVVEWVYVGSPTTIALRVDGAPTRMQCITPEAGTWAAPSAGPTRSGPPPSNRSHRRRPQGHRSTAAAASKVIAAPPLLPPRPRSTAAAAPKVIAAPTLPPPRPRSTAAAASKAS